MFDISVFSELTLEEKYNSMVMMLEGLLQDEEDSITNLSNASALINALIDRINWCGFYLMKQGELVLGPFQGLPACNRIKLGSGVCGTAAKEKRTIRVQNVRSFEGHIACDVSSNSEIVLPIIENDKVYGVLDLDSPEVGRFTEIEQRYLERCIDILNKYIDWEKVTV